MKSSSCFNENDNKTNLGGRGALTMIMNLNCSPMSDNESKFLQYAHELLLLVAAMEPIL